MKMNLAVFIGIAMCAAAVTATTSPHTPLYTVRMEQESNKMNFLPTEVNQFTYTTENGCTVICEVSALRGVHPLETNTVPETCPNTCDDETCYGPTCPETSCSTCSTCSSTCDTCTQPTCETCEGTCPYTCSTCPSTCWNTCSGPTCKFTCEIDC